MQRWFSFREANGASRPYLLPALFFCLSLFGCGNSCFVFVSNPGGTIPPTTIPKLPARHRNRHCKLAVSRRPPRRRG